MAFKIRLLEDLMAIELEDRLSDDDDGHPRKREPLPCEHFRFAHAKHLPVVRNTKIWMKCRDPDCKQKKQESTVLLVRFTYAFVWIGIASATSTKRHKKETHDYEINNDGNFIMI